MKFYYFFVDFNLSQKTIFLIIMNNCLHFLSVTCWTLRLLFFSLFIKTWIVNLIYFLNYNRVIIFIVMTVLMTIKKCFIAFWTNFLKKLFFSSLFSVDLKKHWKFAKVKNFVSLDRNKNLKIEKKNSWNSLFQSYTLLHVCVNINGVPCCTSPVSSHVRHSSDVFCCSRFHLLERK